MRRPQDFWWRVARIAACACIVSAASYALFPQSFIWFGVLHAIAVSLVAARPLVNRPLLALAVAIAVIAAGNLIVNPLFDSRTLGWLGFMTAKPRTEDYVPLFPWAGVLIAASPRAMRCFAPRSARLPGRRRCPDGWRRSGVIASSSTWSISRCCWGSDAARRTLTSSDARTHVVIRGTRRPK